MSIFTSVRIICSLVEKIIKAILTQQRSNDSMRCSLRNYWIKLYYSHILILTLSMDFHALVKTLRCLLRQTVAK